MKRNEREKVSQNHILEELGKSQNSMLEKVKSHGEPLANWSEVREKANDRFVNSSRPFTDNRT